MTRQSIMTFTASRAERYKGCNAKGYGEKLDQLYTKRLRHHLATETSSYQHRTYSQRQSTTQNAALVGLIDFNRRIMLCAGAGAQSVGIESSNTTVTTRRLHRNCHLL